MTSPRPGCASARRALQVGVLSGMAACSTPAEEPELALHLRAPTITEAADGGLTCALAELPYDPGGRPVQVAFAWRSAEGFPVDGATVTAADAARSGEWTCTVAATAPGRTTKLRDATFVAAGPVPRQYAFVRVATTPYPADVVALPDGTLLVASLAGLLSRVDPLTGATLGEAAVATPEDELISLVLDPEFGDGVHDRVYTWTSQSCRLDRHTVTLEPFAIVDTETVEAYACNPLGGHSSGDLIFWSAQTGTPALYLAVGPFTGGQPQDDADGAQGIVAWDVHPVTGALSPALDGGFADPATVAIGLRNPWRVADCGASLCVGDPGSTDYEEINLYSEPGQNFGAGVVEGPGGEPDFVDPVVAWHHGDEALVEDDHDGGGRLRFVKVPTVGVRVSERAYGGRLADVLLYGDFYDGWIRGLPLADDGAVGADLPLAHRRHIMAMTEAADGMVYAVTLDGTVQRLILRVERPVVGEVGSRLSESGYAGDGWDFEVRYPLWSDGADKRRRLQLPTGGRVDVSDPTAWTYPVGTRLWKTFAVAGRNVETRLIEKQEDGWVAGVYVWDGDDAYLSDGTRQDLVLPTGGYEVPSTETCAFCHEATPGREWPIGPEPFQLGYEGLASLEDALSGDPGPVPLVVGASNADEARLRGELHGNCAYCHDEAGLVPTISETRIDLSFDAPSTGLVNAPVYYYDGHTPYEPPTDYLVVPDDVDRSVLLDILEESAMPPVATSERNAALIEDLRAWIHTL